MNLNQTTTKDKPLDTLTKALGLLDGALDEATEAALNTMAQQPDGAFGIRQDLISAREWVNEALVKLARCYIAQASSAEQLAQPLITTPFEVEIAVNMGTRHVSDRLNIANQDDCDGDTDTDDNEAEQRLRQLPRQDEPPTEERDPLAAKLRQVIGDTSRLDLKAATLAYMGAGVADNDAGKLRLVTFGLWLIGPFNAPRLITHTGDVVAEGLDEVCKEIARRLKGGTP